jgi:hypothetical protein
VPGSRFVTVYCPSGLVVTRKVVLFASSVTLTPAPATYAPDGSVTVPTSTPLVICDSRRDKRNGSAVKVLIAQLFISSPTSLRARPLNDEGSIIHVQTGREIDVNVIMSIRPEVDATCQSDKRNVGAVGDACSSVDTFVSG